MVERYNQILIVMMCCYIINHQHEWGAIAFRLTYAYSSQAQSYKDIYSFILVLNLKILDFVLYPTESYKTFYLSRITSRIPRYNAVFSNSPRDSLKRTQKPTNEISAVGLRSQKRIRSGNYEFIGESDDVTKILKLRHAVQKPYLGLDNSQHTVKI